MHAYPLYRRIRYAIICSLAALLCPVQPPALANSLTREQETLLYEACMNRCNGQDDRAQLTQRGCVRGCDELRRTFSVRRSDFASLDECQRNIDRFQRNAGQRIQRHIDWCNQTEPQVFDRRGCRDAGEVYFRNITGDLCQPQPSLPNQTARRPEPTSAFSTLPTGDPALIQQGKLLVQDNGMLVDTPKLQTEKRKTTTRKQTPATAPQQPASPPPVKKKASAPSGATSPAASKTAPQPKETPAVTTPTTATPVKAPPTAIPAAATGTPPAAPAPMPCTS